MSDVFISYAREDQDAVKRLAGELSSSGHEVWVDFEDIPPTAEWMAEIERAIEGANVFVFIASEHSRGSRVCGLERDHAVAMGKRLLDVEVSAIEVRPVRDAVERETDWLRDHTHLLVRSMEWDRKQRDASLLLRGDELASIEARVAQRLRDPEVIGTQSQYVLASRQASSRRQRGMLSISVAVTVLVALLGVLALSQRARAVDREKLARSRILAAESAVALNDPQLALLLALEAWKVSPTTAAEQAVRQTTARVRPKSELIAAYDTGDASVDALTFSNDEKFLITGESDGHVRVSYVGENRYLDVDSFERSVNAIDITPDDRYLLVAAEVTRIRDLTSGAALGDIRTINHGAAFSRDGSMFAGGGEDAYVTVWDRTDAHLVAQTDVKHAPVRDVSFTPDGKFVAAAGGFGVRVIDVASKGKKVTSLIGHSGQVQRVAFSPDGKQLATGGDDGKIFIWDWRKREITQIFTESQNINALEFGPDGKKVVTASRGGSAVVWFLGDRPMRVEIEKPLDFGTAIAISRSGRLVAIGRNSGSFDIVPCDVCGSMSSVLKLAAKRTTREFTPDERAKYL